MHDRDAEPARAPRLAWIVAALGIAQIVSWGTLFYSIGVLGAPMRDELRVSDGLLFGSFSIGLAVSGLAAPRVGHWIDQGYGRRVLGGGSLVAALAMAILALAQGAAMLVAGWVIAGAAMALCLYDPAFAVLHRIGAGSYRRAVTALTLFGGFASTVFWPLSQLLLEAIGWRAAFASYAALHVAACLPLHLACVPRAMPREPAAAACAPPPPAEREPDDGAARFAWLALAFALANFLSSAISAHVIGILTIGGLAARDAVLVGALIGPMQVAGRLGLLALIGVLKPRSFGTIAFALFTAAMGVLLIGHGRFAIAIAFAVLYGAGNGLFTIARGTVPEELFGRRGYGALLGRLARPQLIARAIAPVALAVVFPFDPQRDGVVALCAILAVLAWLAYSRAIVDRR